MNSMYVALVVLVLFAGLGLLLFEMRLRSMRTRVLQMPGGLRFEAQDFSVQVLRKEKELRVQYVRGVWSPAGAGAGQGGAKPGRGQCTFAAPGFRLQVRASVKQEAGQAAGTATGQFEIDMRGADDARLILGHVNGAVATGFESFFLQVHHWIDNLERRAERERVKGLRSEEAAAQAEQHAQQIALLLATPATQQPRSEAERDQITATQVAQWRHAAGFAGQHSSHKADANGVVVWFIDLATDGRITLHADKRTIHSTLRGASIVSSGGELELGVRDSYWTEEEPELRMFKVLRGMGSDERRAWKERLEIIRNSLPAATKA